MSTERTNLLKQLQNRYKHMQMRRETQWKPVQDTYNLFYISVRCLKAFIYVHWKNQENDLKDERKPWQEEEKRKIDPERTWKAFGDSMRQHNHRLPRCFNITLMQNTLLPLLWFIRILRLSGTLVLSAEAKLAPL